MSSSAQFPSGLNNWAGSDKPTRSDFVNDNQLLDEKAMWKAAFDPKAEPGDLTGPVEAAGGISAYALPAAAYDAGGVVAGAGGIPNYVEGFITEQVMTKSAYAPDATAVIGNGKLAVTSAYIRAGTQYDVRFAMPTGYAAGMEVTIDGALVMVCDQFGDEMPLDAAEGVPVTLARFGDRAFPNVGGAVSVNYDVVGGTTQPAGKENRFWVNTSQAIPKFYIKEIYGKSNDIWPGPMPQGTVIVCMNGVQFPFVPYRGTKGAVMYPSSAYQWDGAAWVHRQVQFYYRGGWRELDKIIYDNGITALTWTPYTVSSGSASNTGSVLQLGASITSGSVPVAQMESSVIDVSPFKTLSFTISNSMVSNSPSCHTRIGFRPSSGLVTYAAQANGWSAVYYTNAANIDGTYVVDVSGVSGNQYFSIWQSVTGSIGVGRSFSCPFASLRG